MSLISSHSALLSAVALRTEDVPLPNGQKVRVREMTVAERREFTQRAREPGSVAAWLVFSCCVDEHGTRLFPTEEDAAPLASASPQLVERLGMAALRLSGMGATSEEPAKAPSGPTTPPQPTEGGGSTTPPAAAPVAAPAVPGNA